jgi:Zn ribbon nucleic-acid-binding protein
MTLITKVSCSPTEPTSHITTKSALVFTFWKMNSVTISLKVTSSECGHHRMKGDRDRDRKIEERMHRENNE